MEAVANACLQCGLPSGRKDAYCCYGCELVAEVTRESQEEQGQTQALLTLCFLLSMFVMMLSLFLYAEDVYGATASPSMAKLRALYRWVAFFLSTPVVLLLGVPLFRRSIVSLIQGQLTMDFLVATGAWLAYGVSAASVFGGGSRVYFDSAISALILSTLGRYLEAKARSTASGLLGPSLARANAMVLASPTMTGTLEPTPPSVIEPGMRLSIAVEQTVPVDARLLGDEADLNLGVLTGESLPRRICSGEIIPAGAVPVSKSIECIAERRAKDSTLEQLAKLSRQLSERSSTLQRLADRFARALTPLVAAAAMCTWMYWTFAGRSTEGLLAALAVVLVACPCTFGVAAPLVLWLSLRRALEEGVLIRSPLTLEHLSRVRCVAFDKTGTLTQAALSAEIELTGAATRAEVLAMAAALEEGSPHPLARAVIVLASKEGIALTPLRQRVFHPGRGVEGIQPDGAKVSLVATPTARAELSREGVVLARFHFLEPLRPEAQAALQHLSAAQISALVLSGDSAARAEPVLAPLGLTVHAGLSPEQKVARLEALGEQTAMVGDGLNDAPALASRWTGFALAEGSDLARGFSQVMLLKSDLRLVPWTLALAQKAVRTARTGLVLSTVYNLAFVGLAALGMLRPVWAGVSMLTSSLLTLGWSYRVTGMKPLPRSAP